MFAVFGVSWERLWGALSMLLLQDNNLPSQSSSLPVCWLWFVCWARPQVFQRLGLLFFPFFPVIGQRELRRQSAADFPGTASPGLRTADSPRWEGSSPWKTPSPDAPVGAGGREGVLTALKMP